MKSLPAKPTRGTRPPVARTPVPTERPPCTLDGRINYDYRKWLYHNRPEYRARELAIRAAQYARTRNVRADYGDVIRAVRAIAKQDGVTMRSVYRWLAAGMPIEFTKAQRRAWRKSKDRPKIQPRSKAGGATESHESPLREDS